MPTRSPISRSKTSSRCATKRASRAFRAKKKLDHLLEAALPGTYLPLYTTVTFTRIPYAKAARRARLQDRIMYASLILFSIMLGVALSILVFRFIGALMHAPPSVIGIVR